MKVRATTFATGLSSLLLAVVALVWLRSVRHVEYLTHCGPSGEWGFSTEHGSLHYIRNARLKSEPPRWELTRYYDRYRSNASPEGALGHLAASLFRGVGYDRDDARGTLSFGIPYWLLLLATGVLPALRLLRRNRRKRLRTGAAAVFAFWPFAGLFLAFPDITAADVGELLGSWLTWAAVGAGILFLRDRIREERRRGPIFPWPWQWKQQCAYARSLQGLCVQCGYDLRAAPRRGANCCSAAPSAAPPRRGRGLPRPGSEPRVCPDDNLPLAASRPPHAAAPPRLPLRPAFA